MANAVGACSTTEKETAGFPLQSLSHKYVWDSLLYQNKSSVLQSNTVSLRKFKTLNVRSSDHPMLSSSDLAITAKIASHLLHISRCCSPSLSIYQYLHIQRSLFPSNTSFKVKNSQTTCTPIKQHVIFRVRLDF